MSAWVTWTIVLGVVVARMVYNWRRDRAMDRTLKLLWWRGRFAQTRRALIHLMHCDEVDVHSLTAQTVYLFCSAVARRANSYPELSREVVNIALQNAPRSEVENRVKSDLRAMSPAARELYHDFAMDVHGLLYDYSWIYRSLSWLRHVLPRTARPKPQSPRHARMLGSRRLANEVLVFHRTRKMCEISC